MSASDVLSGTNVGAGPAPDTSQPPASQPAANVPTQPVNVAGNIPPDAAVPTETSTAPDQIPPAPPQGVMTDAGASYQAPPRLWQRVLMGAMAGLAGSAGAKHFGAGLAGGAAGELAYQEQQKKDQLAQQEMREREQQSQATIRFQDAESAYRAASLKRQDAELDLQNKEFNDRHDVAVLNMMKFMQDNFGIQYAPMPRTSAAASNYLQQSTANAQAAGQNGAKLPGGILMDSNNIYVPTGSNSIDNELAAAQKFSKALSLPAPTRQQMAMAGEQGRQGLLQQLQYRLMGYDPSGHLLQANQVPGALSWMQAQRANYAKQPDADPNLLKIMDNSISALQQQKQGIHDEKVGELADAAKQRSLAEGKNVEALINTGIDPITKKPLDNATATEMGATFLPVDTRTGHVIPKQLAATYKPPQSAQNRAQFAGSVIEMLGYLQDMQGKIPNTPLIGWTAPLLAKAGIRGEDAQKALNYIHLIQTAATGAHVAGRFNIEVLNEMKQLIGTNMNNAQFRGATESLNNVMEHYVRAGSLITLGEWNALSPDEQQAIIRDNTIGLHNPGKATPAPTSAPVKSTVAAPRPAPVAPTPVPAPGGFFSKIPGAKVRQQ